MSNICNACKKHVKQSEKIICTRSICARPYHYLCVGLNSDVKKIVCWTCPICVNKQPRTGDNSNTPVKSHSEESPPVDSYNYSLNVTTRKPDSSKGGQMQDHFLEARSDFLNSLKKELPLLLKDAVKSELSTLKNQISTIETTLNFISTQYDDLLKSITTTVAAMKCLKDENARLRKDIDSNSLHIHRLEEEISRMQQWNRLQNIEIVGVPECKEEDTVDIVLKVANEVGVTIERSEVEFAHRVQPRRPIGTAISRTIISRLRHGHTKYLIIAASRKRRGIKLLDMGMTTMTDKTKNVSNAHIYINEHLTKYNRKLLKECKEKAKEANFKFVWTKNCRIYTRRNDTSPPIPIITSTDLAKIG